MFSQSSCSSDTGWALVCWWNYWATVHWFGWFSSSLLIKIPLSWPMSFFLLLLFPFSSPSHWQGGMSKVGKCGAFLFWGGQVLHGSTHHQVKSLSWGWDWDSSTIRCPQEIIYMFHIYEILTIFQLSCKNIHFSGFTLLCHHVGLFLSIKQKCFNSILCNCYKKKNKKKRYQS